MFLKTCIILLETMSHIMGAAIHDKDNILKSVLQQSSLCNEVDIRKSVNTSHIMGAASRDKDDVLKAVISRVASPCESRACL